MAAASAGAAPPRPRRPKSQHVDVSIYDRDTFAEHPELPMQITCVTWNVGNLQPFQGERAGELDELLPPGLLEKQDIVAVAMQEAQYKIAGKTSWMTKLTGLGGRRQHEEPVEKLRPRSQSVRQAVEVASKDFTRRSRHWSLIDGLVPSQQELLELFVPIIEADGKVFEKYKSVYGRAKSTTEMECCDALSPFAVPRYTVEQATFFKRYKASEDDELLPGHEKLHVEGFRLYNPTGGFRAILVTPQVRGTFFPGGQVEAPWGIVDVKVGDYLGCPVTHKETKMEKKSRTSIDAGKITEIYPIDGHAFWSTYQELEGSLKKEISLDYAATHQHLKGLLEEHLQVPTKKSKSKEDAEGSTLWRPSSRRRLRRYAYKLVKDISMMEIRLFVFCKTTLAPRVADVAAASSATGIGHTIGNKGGVGVAFKIDDVSFAFVSAHLAAHAHKLTRRNEDIVEIFRELELGDAGTGKADFGACFHHCFFMGDLNYRIDLFVPPEPEPARHRRALAVNPPKRRPGTIDHIRHWHEVKALVDAGPHGLLQLIEHDQLRCEMRAGRALYGFAEGLGCDLAGRPLLHAAHPDHHAPVVPAEAADVGDAAAAAKRECNGTPLSMAVMKTTQSMLLHPCTFKVKRHKSVQMNSASVEELEMVHVLTMAQCEAIVRERAARGHFTSQANVLERLPWISATDQGTDAAASPAADAMSPSSLGRGAAAASASGGRKFGIAASVATTTAAVETRQDVPQISGWLDKQSHDLLHRMQRRWFVLSGTSLRYYTDPRLTVCKGDLVVLSARSQGLPKARAIVAQCRTAAGQHKTYVLRVAKAKAKKKGEEEDAKNSKNIIHDRWVAALQASAALNRTVVTQSYLNSHGDITFDGAADDALSHFATSEEERARKKDSLRTVTNPQLEFAESDLPSGWIIVQMDMDSGGRYYYFNVYDGTTTFERPEKGAGATSSAGDAAVHRTSGLKGGRADGTATALPTHPPAPPAPPPRPQASSIGEAAFAMAEEEESAAVAASGDISKGASRDVRMQQEVSLERLRAAGVVLSEQTYYTSQRSPAFCDRVLLRSFPGFESCIRQIALDAVEAVSSSDHKPVRSTYALRLHPLDGEDAGTTEVRLLGEGGEVAGSGAGAARSLRKAEPLQVTLMPGPSAPHLRVSQLVFQTRRKQSDTSGFFVRLRAFPSKLCPEGGVRSRSRKAETTAGAASGAGEADGARSTVVRWGQPDFPDIRLCVRDVAELSRACQQFHVAIDVFGERDGVLTSGARLIGSCVVGFSAASSGGAGAGPGAGLSMSFVDEVLTLGGVDTGMAVSGLLACTTIGTTISV